MANFNIDLAQHRIHAFLNRSKANGFWMATGAGLCVAAALVAMSAFQASPGANSERALAATHLGQLKQTTAQLKAEKLIQTASLDRLARAPIIAKDASLNSGGYSEDDVMYWRKQMEAFSLMTGVRLTVVGRGASQFKNATKLTVGVGPVGIGGSSTVGIAPADLIKALDFLQIYGYIESFNGVEAVIHISEKSS